MKNLKDMTREEAIELVKRLGLGLVDEIPEDAHFCLFVLDESERVHHVTNIHSPVLLTGALTELGRIVTQGN